MDYLSESLKLHYELRGKLEIQPRAGVSNKDELSLAYTPGVAAACLEIKDDVSKSYDLPLEHRRRSHGRHRGAWSRGYRS